MKKEKNPPLLFLVFIALVRELLDRIVYIESHYHYTFLFGLEAGAIPQETNNILCENYVLLSRSYQHL